MITFITGNQHKADHLAKLLAIPMTHQKIDLDEIQSSDQRQIVEHKVKQAYEIVGSPVIVDDVSLEFAALGGLPGPFVKWFVEYAGQETMCRMLDGFDDRSAVGKACIGYYDGKEFCYFEGAVHGEIADHPRGDGGYGWDAIFMPDGYDGKTRSELNEQEYAEVYNRIRPLAELRAFLQNK